MNIRVWQLMLLGLFLIALPVESAPADTEKGFYHRSLRIDDAVSEKPDDLLCQTFLTDNSTYQYITEYVPHASSATVHHMSIYGCTVPGVYDTSSYWRCGQTGTPRICGPREKESIVYVWANDAPTKTLPEGTGLRVGGDTKNQYLVIQLHYSRRFEEGETDDSGYTLKMTNEPLERQIGFYVLGAIGYVPPHTQGFHMESACPYQEEYDMHPVAYRTHSHNLCNVSSGYLVQDDAWKELGRMSPLAAQFFYDVRTSGLVVHRGDVLASRCTMNSNREEKTYTGAANHDEMCNFYVMYWTSHPDNLRDIYCFRDSQTFHWRDYLTDIPKMASSLEGVNYTLVIEGEH